MNELVYHNPFHYMTWDIYEVHGAREHQYVVSGEYIHKSQVHCSMHDKCDNR